MILEDEEVERLMARKKAIQATLAAQAQNPAPSQQGGCSAGGCGGSASRAAAPRKAQSQARGDGNKTAVLFLSLLRVAGLAAATGVGIWALVQAL